MDLVLANVEDDEVNFGGRELLNDDQQPTLPDDFFIDYSSTTEDATLPPGQTAELMDSCDALARPTTEKPCGICLPGRCSCRIVGTGRYKESCISCMSLQCECTFNSSDKQGIPTSSEPWLHRDPPNAAPHDAPTTSLVGASCLRACQQQPSTTSSVEVGPQAKIFDKSSLPPKTTRFSAESVKILKDWLSSHSRHPYPSEEARMILQRRTGLTKTQISNWLANARRRDKITPTRSISSYVPTSWTQPIKIPRRPDTPVFDNNAHNSRNLNPLERWVDSPPEDEPASVTAITQAVGLDSNTSLGFNSPYDFTVADDSSNHSVYNGSSASSAGTSSGISFASTSFHGSFGSSSSKTQQRRRRRRRKTAPRHKGKAESYSAAPSKIFQCTFCTETFRTKYDWQRHEKSLHISLEQWACTPEGPRALNPHTNQICCIFCGVVEPDDAHIETHDYSACCLERSLEERTFYRKDHLHQHLRLVHKTTYLDWSMKSWKTASPEIQSRCGFCGIAMDSWSVRVDHLAEHFKIGNTMADWRGDWGFNTTVLGMIENFIPPYLIETERYSPFPYVASGSLADTPRCAYDLIKLELDYFIGNYQEETGTLPCDDELQLEACRIIIASEVSSLQGVSARFSWLRDLLMAERITHQAEFSSTCHRVENRLLILKINGEDNLFEQCPLEHQLREFMQAKAVSGLYVTDDELQQEACRILRRIEAGTTTPSSFIANWLVRLINSSTSWLANFRRRVHLPRTEGIDDFNCQTDQNATVFATDVCNKIERSLGKYIDAQRAKGIEASEDDLQRYARNITCDFDNGYLQSGVDNMEGRSSFKQRRAEKPKNVETFATCVKSHTTLFEAQRRQLNAAVRLQPVKAMAGGCSEVTPSAVAAFLNGPSGQEGNQGAFFLTDTNCYRRLFRELSRFVSFTMSPNNPNRHVPTDSEIQHQARCILFDDDDPWNQTAADNAEWLLRFKRDTGILPAGPGLALNTISWNVSQGGTGFAPPYAFPSKRTLQIAPSTPASSSFSGGMNASPTGAASDLISPLTTGSASSPGSDKVEIFVHGNTKPFETNQTALDIYIKSFESRYQRPASVFCSRELETGLVSYVKADISRGAGFPSDEALKLRGRQILGSEETAADDPSLLGKFKVWVIALLNQPQEEPSVR